MTSIANYNCKQIELYSICRLGWASCLTQIAAFAGFSTFYNALLCSTRQAAIDAAEALPDFQARNGIAEMERTALIGFNTTVLNYFQALKRYIEYTFAPVDWQSQFDAAGMTYYLRASQLDWDSTTQMLVSMTSFITANSVSLTASGGMPVAFPTDVSGVQTVFNAQHATFLSARQDAYVATEEKVTANNAIYADLIAMFSDARTLNFSPALQKQFVFAQVLTLVSGGGLAGVTGTVTSAATGLALSGANVDIPSLGITAYCSTTGEYSIPSIPAGTYTAIVNAPNPSIGAPFIPQTVSITLVTGTTSTYNFALLQ